MIPLVIILDLDGTIIGDITPQIVSWELCNELKAKHGINLLKQKDLHTKLENGIIRPYFKDFITKLKENIPHIEFFIFTASEKKWASYIISQIEKTCNIKFNRPIFTRQHCLTIDNEYKKCLKRITPTIFRTLKKKYNMSNASLLKDRFLIVENNDVYQPSQRKFNVFCKTYDFKFPENIASLFDANEYEKYWTILNKYTMRYFGFECTPDYFTFQRNFYNAYVRQLDEVSKKNSLFLQDKFYRFLYRAIIYIVNTKSYDKFDERMIKYINNQLVNSKNVYRLI